MFECACESWGTGNEKVGLIKIQILILRVTY